MSRRDQPEPCPMAPYAPQETVVAAQGACPMCGASLAPDGGCTRCPYGPPPDAPEQQDDERECIREALIEALTDYSTGKAGPEVDLFDFYADRVVVALASRRPAEADRVWVQLPADDVAFLRGFDPDRDRTASRADMVRVIEHLQSALDRDGEQ